MKTRLFAVLLSVTALSAAAQDVDLDVDATHADVQVPGMRVKMNVRPGAPAAQPLEEPAPPPDYAPAARAPRPPPVQVVGADTFDVRFELKPQETLRLLSPEGAHADIWGDDGTYLGGFDLPCEVPARAGQYYRVITSYNGALVFDRKVELKRYYRTNVVYRGPVAAPAPVVVVAAAPAMTLVNFPALVEAVKAESFGDAKLDVLRTSEGGLTCEQLSTLVGLLSFSNEQVEAVRIMKDRLVDRQNAFTLYKAFTFDSDKQKVKAILGK